MYPFRSAFSSLYCAFLGSVVSVSLHNNLNPNHLIRGQDGPVQTSESYDLVTGDSSSEMKNIRRLANICLSSLRLTSPVSVVVIIFESSGYSRYCSVVRLEGPSHGVNHLKVGTGRVVSFGNKITLDRKGNDCGGTERSVPNFIASAALFCSRH